MEKSSFQKRLCRLLLFCAGAGVLILLLSRFYRCPFYAITGIPCPGCGMTRALLSALRMEWRQALHWNPMVYPLALCCGYAAVCFLMGRTRQAASIRFWGIVGGSSAGSVAAPASVYHLRRFPAVHPAGESGGFSGFPVSLLTDGYRGICFCPFCPESVLTGIRNLWEHPNSLYCFPVD